jgi:hypothetical protein
VVEVNVNWSDAVMIGGLCIAGAALAFYVWEHVRIARQIGGQEIRSATARRIGSARQDWRGGAVWFGLLLVLTSNAFQEVQRGAMAQSILLSLAGVAAGAFICGVYSGRLLLRRQYLLEADAEIRLDQSNGKA